MTNTRLLLAIPGVLLSALVAACSADAESVPLTESPDAAAIPDGAVLPEAGTDATLPDAGDAAPAGPCPADMVHLGGFCMDRFEAPNIAGALPLAFRTAPEGEAWCLARGKRLCTEAEWVRACEGPNGRTYPYGDTHARGRCNDEETWISPGWNTLATYPSDAAIAEAQRLYQGEPSGENRDCVSEEGVFDLTGNVAEWVARSFPHANSYDHVMKGCYWAGCYGGAPPSCDSTNPAHPGAFRTYEAGFRCCKAQR